MDVGVNDRRGAMHRDQEAAASDRTKRSFDRFVNFSDAVFAIAITLLVLDIRLPTIDATAMRPPLATQLPGMMPNIFAFMLSFAVIGGYWVSHHRFFGSVDRSDARLIWLNLVVLFFVVLLPFPTQIVAEYGDTAAGVMIYAAAMTLTGLSIIALKAYAYRAGLTSRDSDISGSMIRSSITPLVFAASIAVALWSPHWATRMWLVAALAFFLVDPILNGKWRGGTAKDAL
jgi:uncharacterized membrane protein